MLTKNDLDRLHKRLERWNRNGNPISVNHDLELVALARKGLDAEKIEKEADWLAEQLLCCTDYNRIDTCNYVSCQHLCANTTV